MTFIRMERCVLGAVLLLSAAEPVAAQIVDPQLAEDRKLLEAAKLPTDGPGLLTVFRKFIPSETEQGRLAAWINQLGADQYRLREEATAALIQSGPKALAALTAAQKNGNLEQTRRAARCIREIEATSWLTVGAAAARLVNQQRPQGATETLFTLLPYVSDAVLGEEIYNALDHLGVPDEATGTMLAQALSQAPSAQRAAAALVLGHHGSTLQRSLVRQTLADPDARVRLRAAQGLLLAGDKTAVDALIALLVVESDVARRAEDWLAQIANRDAPELTLAQDRDMRQETHSAWLTWWRTHRDSIDIAQIAADINLTPQGRARDLGRRLLLALAAGDVDEIKQTIDVPFCVADISLQKWSETEEFFQQALGEWRRTNAKMNFRMQNVVSLEEYLQTARDGTAAFALLPKQTIRVVYVCGHFGNAREEAGAILVRVTGNHPRVIGIGPGQRMDR